MKVRLRLPTHQRTLSARCEGLGGGHRGTSKAPRSEVEGIMTEFEEITRVVGESLQGDWNRLHCLCGTENRHPA